MSEETKPSTYPRFITDKPEGKDLYESQSHARIAENISSFLKENETLSRKVIGIEGEWGSGKSNVIEILKDQLKKDFFFFVYDAWGHQEDLTRRSILEGLLNNLITEYKLIGDRTYWQGQLKNLLAKKIDRVQKNIPKLSWAIIFAVIGILLTPVTQFWAESYLGSYKTETSNPNFWNYLVSGFIIISSFAPLFIWIILLLIKNFKKGGHYKKVFEELFYIYKGQEIINTSQETISEDEPSVVQFTKFLKEIESGIDKKLVIVFDNMDRLPEKNVKEVWSSIHTFFASDDNDLKSWAIVPFDNAHITRIFNQEDKENGKQGDIIASHAESYIHKTFTIVFYVPPPILSDWKDFFAKKYYDAFGTMPEQDQYIETIFEYHHLKNPKIKPRDIIYFINDLVALKKLWKDQIELKYLAVFALKRFEIVKNPFDKIVSRAYLDSLVNLFEFDENLDTNISALTFNVSLNKADEILLKRPIEQALKGEGDLHKPSSHKSFLAVFDGVFYNTQLSIIPAINSLNDLPIEFHEDSKLKNYWLRLSDVIMKVDVFDKKYVDSYKTLIRRITDKKVIERLLKYLLKMATATNDKSEKLYYGVNYSNLIVEIDSLLKEINYGQKVEELLSENYVSPLEFFEFVDAKNSYEKYKLAWDVDGINNYLIKHFDDNSISVFCPQIEIIKSRIDLSPLNEHVNNTIPTSPICCKF
jgi:hypothetical protein